MQLRPYQQQAKDEVKAEFGKGHKHVLLVAPTGSGKTVTFSSIGVDVIRNKKSVMIVCDRKELIGQAKAKLFDYGLIPNLIVPGVRFRPEANCYIASVDTLVRRHYPQVDLVIIDEAHKQTFDKVVDAYPNTFVIGATATPFRKGKQRKLSTLYQTMVEPTNIQELIDLEFLAPARTYGVKADHSDVKLKGGDYEENALYAKFNQPKLYDGVVENYAKFAAGGKALCFNINVEHSRNMTDRFNASGISSAHLDGNTPSSLRAATLRQFKEGHISVLNNCSLFTTGYDEPSIRTVITNRATKSLPLWLQMCGRGSRPDSGKAHFNIIDMGSNVYAHGFWEQDREWSLDHLTRNSLPGVAPVKECPKCFALMHTTKKVCDYCLHIFEVEERKLAVGDFELVIPSIEVPERLQRKWGELAIAELEELRILKGYKMGWIIRQLKARGKGPLEEYAIMRGYKQGWVDYNWEEGIKI